MPKVSIVMPVYNKQDYLRRSLDSVLGQDFSDYELIAVDDGSTDESLKVLEEYRNKDPRIKVIHTENRGVSYARNRGLENIQGDWIQFLDADDLISKDYLQKSRSILNEYDPDILFTSFHKIGKTYQILTSVDVPLIGKQRGSDLQNTFLATQSRTGFYGFISNKLIKRSFLKKTEAKFDENLKLAEDLDFFLQIYPKVSTAYYLPECSFLYLQNDNNCSNDPDIDYLGQLSIQKKIRQWTVDAGVHPIYQDLVDGAVCRYTAYAVYDAAAKGGDIVSVCHLLLQDDVVRSCLKTDYVTNEIHRKIIASLKKNYIFKLAYYLKAREGIKILFGRK